MDLAAGAIMETLANKVMSSKGVTKSVLNMTRLLTEAARLLEEGASTDEYLYRAIKIESKGGNPTLEEAYEEVTAKQAAGAGGVGQ